MSLQLYMISHYFTFDVLYAQLQSSQYNIFIISPTRFKLIYSFSTYKILAPQQKTYVGQNILTFFNLQLGKKRRKLGTSSCKLGTDSPTPSDVRSTWPLTAQTVNKVALLTTTFCLIQWCLLEIKKHTDMCQFTWVTFIQSMTILFTYLLR